MAKISRLCCDGLAICHEKSIELTRQLCSGLAAAHEAGMVHRDIKPPMSCSMGGAERIMDFDCRTHLTSCGPTKPQEHRHTWRPNSYAASRPPPPVTFMPSVSCCMKSSPDTGFRIR
jgi:hypothetical protein